MRPEGDAGPLIVALDVDYRPDRAAAAGVWFRGWGAATTVREAVRFFPAAAEYQPGEFFRRELPCLLGVLADGPVPDVAVVDGYCTLGDGRPGLGMYLFDALGGRTAVVGVAKTRFAAATEAVPICRGGSRAPLFVTAAGADAAEAAGWVAAMHGPYRVPTLLKRADRLARDAVPDTT